MMKTIWSIISLIVVSTLASCIQSDTVDDPVDDPVLKLEPKLASRLVGEELTLMAEYTNEQGEMQTVTPMYHNLTNEIIDVNEDGVVTALAKGKGQVYASFEGTDSDISTINVVESENELAKVIITGPKSNIDVNEQITLTAKGYTVKDVEIPGTSVTWSSEDIDLATVNNEGVVTGVKQGVTNIIAKAGDIEGYFAVSVGLNAATATLMGSSGYDAKGTAELMLDEGGDVILTLSSDFEASFALGTYIFLANSTDGMMVKSHGFEVAEITKNGAHTFNVSTIAASRNKTIGIGEHQYIIILCEPAAITFGYGELVLQ